MIKITTEIKQDFILINDLNIASGYSKKRVKFLGITIFNREDYFDNNVKEDKANKVIKGLSK